MIKNIYTRNNLALIYLFLITFALFFNLIFSGLISDDSYNSQIRGILIENDRSLIEHIFYTIGTWLKESGRILLGWLYIHPMYYYVDNIYLIKIINLSIVASSSYVFYLLLFKLSNNFNYSLASAVVGLVFMQLRSWHDPIMAFTFLIPLLFLLICLCLIIFYEYCSTGSRIKFALVNVLNFTVVFIYELGYFLPLVLYFFSKKLTSKYAKKNSLILITPLVLLIFLFVFSRLFLLNNGSATYDGVNIYFNLPNFIHAFFIQLTSAIPLTYFLKSDYKLLFTTNILFHFFALLFLIFSYCFYSKKIIFNTKIINNRHNSLIIIFCLSLILFPSLIIALSGHQTELVDVGFGYGYIPVFFQVFGFAGLIVYFFTINKFYKYILFVFFIFILFIHFNINYQVIKKTDDFYLSPKIMMEKILDHINENNYEFNNVIRLMKYPSDWKWFYYKKLKKNFPLCDPLNINQNCFSSAENDNFFKEYDLENYLSISYKHDMNYYDNNFYIIAKPTKAYTYNNKIISLETNNLEVFDFNGNRIKSFSKDIVFNLIKIYKSENNNFSDLRDFNFDNYFSNNFLVNYDGISEPIDYEDSTRFKWSQAESTISMYNKSMVEDIKFTMKVHNPSEKDINLILINGTKKSEYHIKAKDNINIADIVNANDLNKNTFVLHFKSDGELINPSDSRKMVFGISNFTLNNILY